MRRLQLVTEHSLDLLQFGNHTGGAGGVRI